MPRPGARSQRNELQPGPSGTRGSRGGSVRSGLTPLSDATYEYGDADDDDVTIQTDLSSIIPRASYKPPTGYFSPSLGNFERYLERTQVQVLVRKLLHILLNRPELPYNPYPGFYGRMRLHQERFHIEKDPTHKIVAALKNPLKDTYIQNLYTVKNYDNIWGLSSILKVINPQALDKYRWLIQDITPSLYDLPSFEDYSNQVMVALVGPSVFDGSLYPTSHFVQLRLEYLVSGREAAQGISIFVNSLMKEIDDMFNSEHHFLLGVNVPAPSANNPDTWIKQYWEPEKIQAEKEYFLQKLSDAVIGNRYIFVDCVFLLDPSYPSFVRGEKQYGFNFVELSDELKEEGLMSFCEFPMASLHEGVFFDRAQAEAYVSLFAAPIDDLEAGTFEAGEGDPPPSPGIVSMGQGGYDANTRPARAATARSNNLRFTASQAQDVSDVHQHVNNRLEQLKPRRVKIDGFRFGDEKNTGAFAWQITTPIKANYQKKIASYWTYVELYEIVYCIIILVLMDRDVFEESGILVEIYRLLHGTAGRLYQLMEHNKSLRAVIQTIANTNDYPIIQPLLMKYKEAVAELFVNPLLERSQDHVNVGRSIIAKVEDMIYSRDMEFASATYLQFTLRGLKNINLYLIPLMMELSEDSLSLSPEVNGMIRKMEDTFPEDNPRPPTRYRKRIPTSFKAGHQDGVEDEVVTHGIEDEHIKRHETSVLNVKNCVNRDLTPQVMVKENVLMKYMLDCHLDDMWSDYLIGLAGGDILPPNPFPRLISILRQSAMKMDLFYEKASVITEKMFNLEVKIEDRENFIYHIPGLDAHGCVTALMMVDTGVFKALSDIVRSFQQKSYIQKKGPYRVGICLALSGPSIWYGRMLPYLNEVQLHEHYYIQGPSGCQGEAIQLCALVVHNHMVDMINKSGLPVMGVYFGSPSPDHWTSDDVLTKKKGFLTQFATTCNMKQPIYAKAYVILDKWRYVTMVKHFMLHFLEEGTKPQIFYPEDHAAYYLSVFLSKERAAFHYQNCGPPNGGDPMGISNVKVVTSLLEGRMLESQRKMDWLSFYRQLLLRDLITQDQSKIADCWRVFHSMTGQVEYVTGMMEVIQDLVITCLVLGVDDKQSRQSSRSGGKTKNPVDQKILTKMVMAFYQKLMYVCEARLTMAARALTDYIENKLKSALEFDPETGQPFLALEDQTIFRLEEMKSIMKIFQDTLGGDVRSVCQDVEVKFVPQRLDTPKMILTDTTWPQHQPRAPSRASRAGLAGVQQGQPVGQTLQQQRNNNSRSATYLAQPDTYHRPDSVASNMLDDPNFYRKKRATNMMTVFE